jgi:hypothetical protein
MRREIEANMFRYEVSRTISLGAVGEGFEPSISAILNRSELTRLFYPTAQLSEFSTHSIGQSRISYRTHTLSMTWDRSMLETLRHQAGIQ